MAKWVKNDSKYATGSSSRVTQNLRAQAEKAQREAAAEAKRQRAANPTGKADKNAKRR